MELFEAAVDLPPERREGFLRQECGRDTRLLEAVLQQLAKDAELGDEPPETTGDPFIGTTVGPYRVKSLLGEGGYGSVYLAERQAPMVQQVALKIIRAGRDSKSVLARFDQERQALALMDHPNIAKVFDAGSTADGKPYFVMEYVAGEPITDFCDSNRLTVSERLELFISVCEAVQHAHQKAIIHRDLKPRNILVSRVDGKPVAKVIDFGIAKATGERLIDQTIETMQGIAVGTLLYMSPEQADGGKQDVDTRSDVYSLGVVLYELLAGILPHDAQTLLAAGQAEMHRIIREVDPPKPSTRLETIDGQTGTAIGTARGEDRSRLASQLRKELEWIPMMALRKDRSRRYGSAAAMAADVRRYLEGKPLDAAPESRAYLVRKFVRRNRLQVGAVSAVLLALSAGLALSLWQRSEAMAARDAEAQQRVEAEQQRARADERAAAAENAEKAEKERAAQLKQVSDFQSKMLMQIDTTTAGVNLMKDLRERFSMALDKTGVPENDRTTRVQALRQELTRVNATDAAAAMIDQTILRPAVETIDKQFKDQPVVDAQLRQALADLYYTIGLYDLSLPLQEAALSTRRRVLGDEHPDTILSVINTGVLLRSQGKLPEAEVRYRQALETSRRVLGGEHPDTLTAIHNMGFLLQEQGKYNEAERYCLEALEKRRRIRGREHPETLTSVSNMGYQLQIQGKLTEAEPYWVEALEISRRVLGQEHPDTLAAINNMGFLRRAQGRFAESESFFREGLAVRRRVLGEDHPDTLTSIGNMGSSLRAQGKLTEAGQLFGEALDKARRVLGEEHPYTLIAINNMGFLLRAQGKYSDAEVYAREALEKSRRVLGESHPDSLRCMNNMGILLQAQGKPKEAEPYLREALEKRRSALGPDHSDTLSSITTMASVLRAQGKLSDAEPLAREAMERSRRVLGEEHSRTLGAINSFAALLREQGKLTQAAAHFQGLLDTNRRLRGELHKDTLDCYRNLIDLHTSLNSTEPGKGHDSAAADLRVKLEAAQAKSAKPAGTESKPSTSDPK